MCHSPRAVVRLVAGLAIAASLVAPAKAAVTIMGTRLVYPAGEREISVRFSNDGEQPALMQIWVDRGDPKVQAQDADAPFVSTPPIFRLDPRKGQTVRLAFVGEKLPGDRETLFWFNALEIPPMPALAERSYLQVAVRSRLKLFYRPAGLPGAAASAATQLRWGLVDEGGLRHLRVVNPTPYHVSLSALRLSQGGRDHELRAQMIAPFAQRDFDLSSRVRRGPARLSFRWISDFGAATDEHVQLP
ncbi:fimbrial biogenesis chaperone [Pseudomonas citronellolis]|uniref:fimbrial biogenesis chaperone n=1 Tax=Pseudomonas citronellolis TaxID=53408 RepID=UPI0023E37473|nr:fimbria/pilus periplasmic chaperone [Pseudomonas citronellolis]MDF3931443.1 fimbria/pilus periplasmic chaperone [Pseudomonas citronellolis]